MNTQDPILLKVYRQFSREEGMKVLFQEISSLKVRIGELMSERDELEDSLNYCRNKKQNKEVIIIRESNITV